LNRSRATIDKYYPRIAAAKLKKMYAENHPLKDVPRESFGKATEKV